MPEGLKALLTIIVSTVVVCLMLYLVGAATGLGFGFHGLAVAGLIAGLLYGLEAGIVGSYALHRAKGWVELLVDLTWSLPNTLFGLIVGNLIYIFIGNPSPAESRDQGWIVFKPRGSSAFGTTVLQTLGTVNLGGAGAHERVHLLQSRLFGPLYLIIFGLNYVVNFLLQCLWCATAGWFLKVLGTRNTVPLEPPVSSVVQGFFGWIYAATIFEIWAYGSERHG
jgi:hypothetical protein